MSWSKYGICSIKSVKSFVTLIFRLMTVWISAIISMCSGLNFYRGCEIHHIAHGGHVPAPAEIPHPRRSTPHPRPKNAHGPTDHTGRQLIVGASERRATTPCIALRRFPGSGLQSIRVSTVTCTGDSHLGVSNVRSECCGYVPVVC